MIFLWRHLLESTVVCCFLACLAFAVPSGGRRHVVWFGVAAKFVLPTVLLSGLGSRLAAEWPPSAASFVHWFAKQFNAALHVVGWSPSIVFQNRYAPLLATIWILGFVTAIILWRRAWKSTETETQAPSGVVDELFLQVSRRLGIANITLRICLQGEVVTLRGIRRPALLLSKDLVTQLSSEELEGVFIHELGHARRRDNLTAAIAHAVTCLFWFHPLLWIAERQMQRERECACDDEVVASGVDCDVYLHALSKVCLPFVRAAAGVSAMGRTDLQIRLARLRCRRKNLFLRSVPPVLVSGLLLMMTIFPVASGYCEECVSHADANVAGAGRR